MTAWYATCAPAHVPRAILDKLNAAVVKSLKFPDVHERYVQNTVDVMPMSRDELAAFIRVEIAKWVKVAQSAGISLD